jgi:hypothetical protein
VPQDALLLQRFLKLQRRLTPQHRIPIAIDLRVHADFFKTLKFGAIAGTMLLISAPAAAAVSTLMTPSYEIIIDVRCEEGVLGCDDVHYVGTNRKTGKKIVLRGTEVFHLCADGVTPCRFLYYRFRNGNVNYIVSDD